MGFQGVTSHPTSESSSKKLNLGCNLNQTWTRPDLDLPSPELVLNDILKVILNVILNAEINWTWLEVIQ